MEDEDLTWVELEASDATPVTSSTFVFAFMCSCFNRTVTALKAISSQVQSLTPVSAHALSLAVHDVLDTGSDLYRLLTAIVTEDSQARPESRQEDRSAPIAHPVEPRQVPTR